MGIKLREETLVEEGTASVDIAFDFGSNSVAIEVDGPSHYTLNTFQQTGPTRMRQAPLSSSLRKQWKIL
jgi:hypothetical protein